MTIKNIKDFLDNHHIYDNLEDNFSFISREGKIFSPNFGKLAILFAPKEYLDKNCNTFKKDNMQERLAKNLLANYIKLIVSLNVIIELVEDFGKLEEDCKIKKKIKYIDKLRINTEYFLIRSISITEFIWEFYKDCFKVNFNQYREDIENFIDKNFQNERRDLLRLIVYLFTDKNGIRDIVRNRLLHFPLYALNISYRENEFYIEVTDENVDTRLGVINLIDLFFVIIQSLYLFYRLQMQFLLSKFSSINLDSDDLNYLKMIMAPLRLEKDIIDINKEINPIYIKDYIINEERFLKFLKQFIEV